MMEMKAPTRLRRITIPTVEKLDFCEKCKFFIFKTIFFIFKELTVEKCKFLY